MPLNGWPIWSLQDWPRFLAYGKVPVDATSLSSRAPPLPPTPRRKIAAVIPFVGWARVCRVVSALVQERPLVILEVG